MKKVYAIVFFLFLEIYHSPNFTFATLNYGLSFPAPAFAYNTTPTYILGPGGVGDLDSWCSCQAAGPYPIGFNFNFGGVLYNQFDLDENGHMTLEFNCTPFSTCVLNPNAVNQLAGNAGQTANNERPIIAPLWDDLAMGRSATSSINYKLTGSSPNQVLTIEWREMEWSWAAANNGTITFQVKLYETSGVIDFVYRQEAAAVGGTRSASIGLEGQTGTDYYSIQAATATPAVTNNASEMSTISTRPPNNTIYRWTPVAAPVELLSFTGNNLGEKNLLEWATASESNNDYFTIEKSQDGISYSELIRIKGAGNSSTNKNYSAIDSEPYPNLTYYRLKQTDFNGDFTYSSVISISDSPEITISLAPNPSHNDMHLNFTSEKEIIAQADIINSFGQCVMSRNLHLSKGTGFINFDIGILPQGIYLFKFGNSIFQKQIKFLKL